jgi:hypothetical protein
MHAGILLGLVELDCWRGLVTESSSAASGAADLTWVVRGAQKKKSPKSPGFSETFGYFPQFHGIRGFQAIPEFLELLQFFICYPFLVRLK